MKTDPLGQSFMDFAETQGWKFTTVKPDRLTFPTKKDRKLIVYSEKIEQNEAQHTCLNKEIGIQQAYQNAGSETCDRLMEVIRQICKDKLPLNADTVIMALLPIERTKEAKRAVCGALKRACKEKLCEPKFCRCCYQAIRIQSVREGNNNREIIDYQSSI